MTARGRVGVWLIGAKGGIGSTVALGLSALQQGLTGKAGLVSELPRFSGIQLADWQEFVIGGHEIREVPLYDEAMRFHEENRVFEAKAIETLKPFLDAIDTRIKPGTLFNVGNTISSFASPALRDWRETPRAAIERIQHDLKQFAADNELSHTIVVNIASTEPVPARLGLSDRWSEVEKLLDSPNECPLPASSLYAIAALDMGCSYVNFTPSLGSSPPAIDELARLRRTRHMGYDGKTGETLLKSVLAPMFAKRNLEVMSWVGHNIFGNLDGKVLDDPINKKSKVTSKDRLLSEILGYPPQTLVSIEYIQSLGDWKTAWDHIHFKGFLGTPMVLQFTWQGCDSILAAPLVLDLIRFTERAWRHGDVGQLGFLSSFFKSPLGMTEHDFSTQFAMLEAWADQLLHDTPSGGPR